MQYLFSKNSKREVVLLFGGFQKKSKQKLFCYSGRSKKSKQKPFARVLGSFGQFCSRERVSFFVGKAGTSCIRRCSVLFARARVILLRSDICHNKCYCLRQFINKLSGIHGLPKTRSETENDGTIS